MKEKAVYSPAAVIPKKTGKTLSKSSKTADVSRDSSDRQWEEMVRDVDVDNPFLLLINPAKYFSKVCPKTTCLHDEGLIYTPVNASLLHRPKRMYIVMRRNPETGELVTVLEAEYNLRFKEVSHA